MTSNVRVYAVCFTVLSMLLTSSLTITAPSVRGSGEDVNGYEAMSEVMAEPPARTDYDGDTYYVGTEAGDLPTIQAAVDSTQDGDIVVVRAGTYDEEVEIGTEIMINGRAGAKLVPPAGVVNPIGFTLGAHNVTIAGMNISDFWTAVDSHMFGHNISDNTFWMNDRDINNYANFINIHSTFSGNGYMLSGNRFERTSSSRSVYIDIRLVHDRENESDTGFGDLTLTDNIFRSTATAGDLVDVGLYAANMRGGSLKVGEFLFSGNHITGGGLGLEVDLELAELTDTDVTVGNFTFADNRILGHDDGGMNLDLYNFGYLYEGTTITTGDVTISRNEITTSTSSEGIYVSDYTYLEYLRDDASIMIGELFVENNEIDCRGYGIYVAFGETAYELRNSSRVIIEDIHIKDNRILNSSYGVYVSIEYAYEIMDRASCILGDIMIEKNMINTSVYGIRIYEYYLGTYMYDNGSFSMGRIAISENDVTAQSTDAYDNCLYISLGEIGNDMDQSSSVTIGKIEIFDNDLTGYYGIFIDRMRYFAFELHTGSSFEFGGLSIYSNEVHSEHTGIYLGEISDIGSYLYDNSEVHIGNISVSSNRIWSNNSGIKLDFMTYIGYYLFDDSIFIFENLTMTNNRIWSDGDGLHLDRIQYWGYEMKGSSVFIMNDMSFTGNTLTEGTGFLMNYITNFGIEMEEDTRFRIGDINISTNRIGSTSKGIILYNLQYLGCEMIGRSVFEMGNIHVIGNSITAGDDGLSVNTIDLMGNNMMDNATFSMGDIRICENGIDSSGEGIYVGGLEYLGYRMKNWSSFSMGNILMNENRINADIDQGIHVHQFSYNGYYLEDEVIWRMEDWVISKNTIRSNNDGIHIDSIAENANHLSGEVLFEMGEVLIVNNSIVTNGTGIDLPNFYEAGYYLMDNVDVSFKGIHIDGNDISSMDDGISLYILYPGEDLQGTSKYEFGNITFNGNNISSFQEGISVSGLEYLLSGLNDNTRSRIGQVQVRSNDIESGGNGVSIEGLDNFGYGASDGSRGYFEGIIAEDNIIDAGLNGVVITGGNDLGYLMGGEAEVIMGPLMIVNNSVKADGRGVDISLAGLGNRMISGQAIMEGVRISGNTFNTGQGLRVQFQTGPMTDRANVTVLEVEVSRNTFTGFTDDDTILLDYTSSVAEDSKFVMGSSIIERNEQMGSNLSVVHIRNAQTVSGSGSSDLGLFEIRRNNITGGDLGLELENVVAANVYLNNFIANMDDISVTSSQITWVSPIPMWYRFGPRNFSSYMGNYWDSYTGPDNNNDGIGDNPYNTGAGLDTKPLKHGTWELLPPWNDVTPPEVTITSHYDGQALNSVNLTLEWTVSDDLLGVMTQWVRLDAGAWVEVSLSTRHSFNYLTEGEHTFTVRARDRAGNERTASVNLTIDLTPPLIFFEHPADGSAFNGTSVLVSWNGTDLGSDISGFHLALDDGPFTDMDLERMTTVSNLSEGVHLITLRAEDGAGNIRSIDISIILDLTPPVIDIVHPLNGSEIPSDRINATWTGDGGLSNMAAYGISLDGSNFTGTGTRAFRMLSGLEPGEHVLEVIGMDSAGNWNFATSVFIVDPGISPVEIIYPPDGSRINRTSFEAVWKVNGPIHPLLLMEFRLDGGGWRERNDRRATLFDLPEGDHVLDVRATDIRGNIMASTSRFTVDLTGPVVRSLSHQGTSALAEGPVVIRFSEPIAADSVMLLLNGEVPEHTLISDVIEIDPGEMDPGTVYMLNISVKDLAGNLLKQTITFTTGAKGTVTGRIVDGNGDPVELVEIVFDTGEEAITSTNGSFIVDITAGSRIATVLDGNGNEIGSFQATVIGGGRTDLGDIEVEPIEEEERFPWWILGIAALGLLLIVGIAAFVLVMKGKEEAEEEEEFDEEIWEDEEDEDYYDDEDLDEEFEDEVLWEDEE